MMYKFITLHPEALSPHTLHDTNVFEAFELDSVPANDWSVKKKFESFFFIIYYFVECFCILIDKEKRKEQSIERGIIFFLKLFLTTQHHNLHDTDIVQKVLDRYSIKHFKIIWNLTQFKKWPKFTGNLG